jgi:mRNA interferase RelE/StbE
LVTGYLIVFMPQARDDLRRLDKRAAQRILHKLKWLSQNFEDLAPHRLAGEFREFYKVRVGSYRVIYTAEQEDHRLVIHVIGHRRDIYKR